MLQSWDNVANVHHSKLTYSGKIYLPSCMSTVSTVCTQQYELWTYYFIDHTPRCRSTAAAQAHHFNGDVLALLERQIYHQTMTCRQRTDLSSLASLEARWPAEQASQNARRFAPFIQECISMATLVCAHGAAILTNRGHSELVAECIYKKNDRLKNIFCI